MPRIKKLTDYNYSPTNPASEDAIRLQIDDSIQEVYDAAAKNTDTVNKTGNQTIADIKTFTSSPVVPDPITDMQVANKKGVDVVQTNLNTHKTSTDHDGRYYTETEVNALLLANQQGNHTGTWQGYNPVQTDPGIQNIVNDHTRQILDLHVNVKDFGAVGDGVTNDLVALELAKNYALLNGGIFFIPSSMNCKIVGNLDLSLVLNVDIQGIITGSGLTDQLILASDSRTTDPVNYFVNRVVNIKIKIQGIKNGNITINECPYLLLWADGDVPSITSIAYSRFNIGSATTFEINSQGSSIGWINENVFTGGRISTFIMNGNYPHNNNTFYKPMFESCSITISKGSSNQFYDCRFEGTNVITFDSGTFDNILLQSWTPFSGAYLRQSTKPTVVNNGLHNLVRFSFDALHSFNKVHEVTPTSNNYNVSKFTKNLTNITNLAFSNIYESDLIELVDDIGFSFESDQPLFRSQIFIYDINKTQIMVDVPSSISTIYYDWNAGGYYYCSSSEPTIYAALLKNATVKYFKIIVTAYNSGTFKKATVKFIEQKGKETNIFALSEYTKWNSNSIPSTGTWSVGDIVWNNDPAGSEYIGWTCITAGTPGTWKGFGLIQA